MQDRQPPNRKNFLRHTAGPHIRVIFDAPQAYRIGLVYLNDRKCGAHSDTSESRQFRTCRRGCFLGQRFIDSLAECP